MNEGAGFGVPTGYEPDDNRTFFRFALDVCPWTFALSSALNRHTVGPRHLQRSQSDNVGSPSVSPTLTSPMRRVDLTSSISRIAILADSPADIA